MKTKYLFGMLLSGAMLAACTAEDDLNPAKLAQEVNQSAPVFTVNFGDDELKNRAEMNSNNQLGFQEGDLLSLYHGGVFGLWNNSTQQFEGDGTFSANGNNAIYEGHSVGEAGFEFTTKSMVKPGRAVLVYPADTTETGIYPGEVVLKIDKDQDENTVKKTPYMSEILTIDPYSGHVENSEAGYGRTYDIALKRVGTTLNLTMDYKNTPDLSSLNVPAIEVKKVALTAKNYHHAFTTGIRVKGLDKPSVAYKAPTASSAGAHLSWLGQSDVDTDNLWNYSYELTTTALKDDVATFTLLPSATGTQLASKQGRVVVNTIYGKVDVEDTYTATPAAADKIWSWTTNASKTMTVTDGLNNLLSNDDVLWAPTAVKTNPFYNTNDPDNSEKAGGYVQRKIQVNLANLDMSELHIENEEHLKAALKVYNYLKGLEKIKNPTDDVFFYLDGTDGVFEMHKEAWTAVVNQLKATGNKVNFVPCRNNGAKEECHVVKLINDGEEAEEVPELKFTWWSVDLELEGEAGWNYKSSSTANKKKDLQLINTVIAKEGTTLTLEDYVNIKSGSVKFVVEKNADATVNGEVILESELENFGTITIKSADLLRVGNGGKLTNREAQGKNDTGWTNDENAAQIDNYGVLGIVESTTGTIYNYGVITVANGTARTLISENGDGDANLTTLFGNTVNGKGQNRFGTINLFQPTTAANNRTVVNDPSKQGFIKIHVNVNKPSKATTAGNFGEVANYIVLDAGCTELNTSINYNATIGNSKVKYVEIANGKEVLVSGGTSSAPVKVEGLFVRNNSVIDIPQASFLTVTNNIYLSAGKIYRAGTLTLTGCDFEGYYGGDAVKDKLNITTY